MIKSISQFTLFFVSINIILSGCGTRRASHDKTIISVNIMPEKYFIDRLTGSSLEVNVMLPPGANHATYSPTPQQFKKLSDSRLYIEIGHLGFEQAWSHRLKELNPSIKVLNLSEKTALIHGTSTQHGAHSHEGGIDPHIWMSPKVMAALIYEIKNAIAESFPEMREAVEANYPQLLSEIKDKDRKMCVLAASLSRKEFLIFHPALTYIERDYGFTQIPVEFEGKEPSTARLVSTIELALSHNISVIFVQEEYDIRNAELIAKETDATPVRINPMAYDWMKSIDDVITAFQNHLQ
ncbi:MAG: zinc ABC transporter substrate-binding protein [Cytophagaceae bacterium]|jgi:zinc transport system substrate-binding protein|nr:zinc ABC transporter substrate-binding protein [Cytophagaceae bacterium]